MIKAQKNENFQGIFNIIAFGKLLKQVQGRFNANSIALDLAKQHGHTHYMNHRNELVEVSK
jgi:hypothetical protein